MQHSVSISAEKRSDDLSPEQAAKLDEQSGRSTEPPKVSLLSLWRYANGHERALNYLGLLAALGAGIAQPTITIIFGRITSAFVAFRSSSDPAALQTLRSTVNHNVGILALIGIAMFACVFTYSSLYSITGDRVTRRTREKYLASCLRQNIGFLDTLGAGEISQSISTNANLLQDGISEKLVQLVQQLTVFFAALVIALATNWRITVVLLSIIPAYAIVVVVMSVTTAKSKRRTLEHLGAASNIAEEAIGSIKVVHAFSIQDRVIGLFEELNILTWRSARRAAALNAVCFGLIYCVFYAAHALGFFWGASVFLQGHASVGDIVTTFSALLTGANSLLSTSPLMAAVTNATSAASKLFAMIERVPPIDSSTDKGRTVPRNELKGAIELRNVTFRYPSRPEVPVLRNISLKFPAGRLSALVGPSGGGKSSSIGLLLRFFDPIEGRVWLDGVPLAAYNLRWLRSQIGLVSQEPTLFSCSVFENIAYGLIGTRFEDVDEEKKRQLVVDACMKANADAFVRALPQGYETKIGDRGLLLSGGQRQRIAIARAIVSDPAILLLDEATSALDSKSERVVQEALDKASEGRTTIAIAHRLSTIRNAHVIHVLREGQRVESGNHAELIEQNGIYAGLVRAQSIETGAVDTSSDASTVAEDDTADGESITGTLLDLKSPVKLQPFDLESNAEPEANTTSLFRRLTTLMQAGPQVPTTKYPALTVIRRIIGLNRSQWRLHLLAVPGSTIVGCIFPIFAILFGKIVTIFALPSHEEIRSQANHYALLFFIVSMVAWVASTASIWGWQASSEFLGRTLRRDALRATLRQDIAFFDDDKNTPGTLSSQIANNADQATNLLSATGGVITQAVTILTVGFIVGFAFCWQVALLGIACLPFTVTTGFVQLYVVLRKNSRNEAAYAKSSQLACEAANAVRTIASLNREDDVVRLYSKELDGPQKTTARFAIGGSLLYATSTASVFWVQALIFWYGSRLISEGAIQTENFYVALEAVIIGMFQAGNLFVFAPDVAKSIGAGRALLRMLDAKPAVAEHDGIALPSEKMGRFELDNVKFRYPTRPHVPVLQGLSLEIKADEFVALVGPSGCGKSTVISLLERFYDVASGSIKLDGSNLSTLDRTAYRSQVALVSQDTALFTGSIKSNLLLGCTRPEDISQEELEKACKDANIFDFISGLPQGFDTQLGGKGAQLSGGQRQRLAIARALIRQPQLLLLDEATAALDSDSERIVQRALDEAARGRTTVAVAHRLSSIVKATRICYVDGGKIVESGTHEQLLAKRGRYFELVQSQSLSASAS